MHIKAKKMAVSGMMLAITVICMILGSVIESSTLFLLAAASFFVGIICREFGMKTGCTFYAAGVLLGFILAPNKLYVVTYSAMGIYILVAEIVWRLLGKSYAAGEHAMRKYKILFWVIKYAAFNLMYIPAVVGFQNLLFGKQLPMEMLIGVLLAGQAGVFIYDRAYEYVQVELWNKMRGKLFE